MKLSEKYKTLKKFWILIYVFSSNTYIIETKHFVREIKLNDKNYDIYY